MQIVVRTGFSLLLLTGFAVVGCTVNDAGLATTGRGGASGGSAGPSGTAGISGGAGTTGVAGTGGGAGQAGATGAAGLTGGGTTGQAGTGGGTAGDTGTGLGGEAGTGAAGTMDTGIAGSTGGDTAGASGTGGTTGAAGTGGLGGSAAGGRGGTGGRGTTNPCDASNCPTGCCQGNTCITIQNDKMCGTAGAQCAACDSCFRCGTSHSCEPNPSSNWTVTCESAVVKATKPNGMTWDTSIGPGSTSSYPDPFCRLMTSDGRSRATTSITDTLDPTWDANVTPTTGGGLTTTLLTGTGWSISILDQDATSSETICTTTPSVTTADFQSGMVTVNNVGSCTEVVLGLACVP